MIEVTAYQCDFCKSVFVEAAKAKKCNNSCYRKDRKKKRTKAYQNKLRKQADWFRLNLANVEDVPRMIEEFYKKFHKRKVSIDVERGIKIDKSFIVLSIKGSSLDGKHISYDPLTSNHAFGLETRDGGPIIRGMDLYGGASGYGTGFSAGIKIDINECPKLKALFEERNSLKEKINEYNKVRVKIQTKVQEIVNSDELYISHRDRQKIFGSYSYLANKLANERSVELHKQKYPEVERELMTEDLKDAYKRYSELSSALRVDNE